MHVNFYFMPKSKSQKDATVAELSASLAESKGVVFVNPGNINVADVTMMRQKCQKEGVRYFVAKKTLLTIALREAGIEFNAKTQLEGTVGIAFSQDEIAPAKTLAEFGKGREGFALLGGILEKSFIDKKGVTALAKLPSKQEMLGMLVGTIQAPVSSFVRVLNGNVSGFVRVLGAISAQKGA